MTITDEQEQTAQIVNELFRRLEGIIPAFDQMYSPEKTDRIKQEWVKEFIAQRLSDTRQIERGLSKLRAEGPTFLPPVAYFVALCRPKPEPEFWDDIRANPRPVGKEAYDLELLRCYIHGMRYIETKHGEKLLNSFFKSDNEKAYAKQLYDRWLEAKFLSGRRRRK